MGVFGCSNDGNLNDAKFAEPLPWIGVYIAAASLVCLIAMVADVMNGIRHRKFWFPCRFFTLNSTSLTLIAVAIKLSVDLNTSMPRREDQLAKLSSTVLMCTIMGNSMPSLGNMENQEIFMNIMALGILVITLIVNIGIELGTGVIYVFLKEHVFIVFLMLVLLGILSFSALTVPTIKSDLEMKYSLKHNLTLKEYSNETSGKAAFQKLKEDMVKYWIMAHTCSPQFVIGRSAPSTASGAICLLSAAILAEAIVTSYWLRRSFNFCSGESDYKWSTALILIIQSAAVGLGTIAPAFRWFMAINFRCPKQGKGNLRKEFTLEKYWVQYLIEMRYSPLTFRIQNRRCRKLAHKTRDKFLNVCIKLQTAIVFTSKVIRLISILLVSGIFSLCNSFKSLKTNLSYKDTISLNTSESDPNTDSNLDLSHFVLHLEGEEELVQLMIENNCHATNHWIKRGKSKKPKHLINLLETTLISRGFTAISQFDNYQVPSLDSSKEPPNCWALPIVTLTTLAISLPNTPHRSIKQLLHAVTEALPYIQLIEETLDTKPEYLNLKKAADIIWLGIDLHHKWLGLDIEKTSHHVQDPKQIIQKISDYAKKTYVAEKKRNFNINHKNWPVKILAANCMYRISESILVKKDRLNDGYLIFGEMKEMIAAIMGACFTNLEHVVSRKCTESCIERRERSVREAAYILGKMEKIMELVEKMAIRGLDSEQMGFVDEWRLAYRLEI